MKIIMCVAFVAAAFLLGWNANHLKWLHKIDDILHLIGPAVADAGKLSDSEIAFTRGMLKTIALLQGYEEN